MRWMRNAAVVAGLVWAAPAAAQDLAATAELPAALQALGGEQKVLSTQDARKVRGQAVGTITTSFSPTSVLISSTKDLSNVVLQFADGDTYKFDGLSGKTGTFSGIGDDLGKQITGVWVKSGNNHSGDGPGYGEFFKSPLDFSGGGGGGTGGGGGGTGGGGTGGGGTGGGTGTINTANVLEQYKSFSLKGATLSSGSSTSLLEGAIGTVSSSGSSGGTTTTVEALFGGLAGTIKPTDGGLNFNLSGKALQESLSLTGGSFSLDFSQFYKLAK